MWDIPTYDGPLGCELWLLEPPAPMSGVEQSWTLSDLGDDDLETLASIALTSCASIEGSRLAVAELDLPIFVFEGGSWKVGDFIEKQQVRIRRNMPRGLLMLMREILAQHALEGVH